MVLSSNSKEKGAWELGGILLHRAATKQQSGHRCDPLPELVAGKRCNTCWHHRRKAQGGANSRSWCSARPRQARAPERTFASSGRVGRKGRMSWWLCLGEDQVIQACDDKERQYKEPRAVFQDFLFFAITIAYHYVAPSLPTERIAFV